MTGSSNSKERFLCYKSLQILKFLFLFLYRKKGGKENKIPLENILHVLRNVFKVLIKVNKLYFIKRIMCRKNKALKREHTYGLYRLLGQLS